MRALELKSMPHLRIKVGNFLGKGESVSHYGDRLLRDTLEFACAGFSIRFIQAEEIVLGNAGDLVGGFVESTTVEVANVIPSKKTKALAVVDRVCWLLSFAGQSSVVRYAHEYPLGSGAWRSRSVVGASNFFRPPIDIIDGAQTIRYVETCYPQYAALERTRKLNVVFDYLVHMEKRGTPIELRLLMAFVVLENLKDTYARSIGIPYVKGFFRKRPNGTKSSPKYSFEELLTLMLKAVGMRKGLKRVISLRNEIIHSGVTRKPAQWQWRRYEHLRDLLQEYLLRLLNYRGYYLTYKGLGDERVEL